LRHTVKVTDHETGELLTLEVPEDRYVLFEAEQQGWELPNACRMVGLYKLNPVDLVCMRACVRACVCVG
jgi:hypothetical protein